MLALVPSFGLNPRDFLVFAVSKACQRRALCTWVPRCWGVARSASSLKAAQALACSLTPGLCLSCGCVPAWHGLPQCPGYGHWVSYCCVTLVFGSRLRVYPANSGWGLEVTLTLTLTWGTVCVCFGSGFGFAAPILAAGSRACVSARASAATR